MAIKIEMLRCFCEVARAGNLSDAADRLGRTQSAVSMTLKQLETHLGSPLFEGERKTRLTPLGKQVLSLGQSQIKQFDSTILAIETSAKAPNGILRISAVPSVATQVFPRIVEYANVTYPGLKVELRDADTDQVLESLDNGWADIGIASAKQEISGVSSGHLFSDPYGLVFADHHPLAQGTGPIAPDQVFAQPFLYNALCNQLTSSTIQPFLRDLDITVHTTQSLLAMLCENDWVTILPRSVIKLVPKKLAFRKIEGLNDHRQVYVYVREQTFSQRIIENIGDLIARHDWAIAND